MEQGKDPAGDRQVDVFVSYAGPDRPWAEWAAWQAEGLSEMASRLAEVAGRYRTG